MIKAAIFDFYEVISTPSYMTFVQEHVPEAGRPELVAAMAKANKNLLAEADYLAVLQKYSNQDSDAIRTQALGNSVIDQDVIQIARELKANYKVGLLTNAIGSLLDDIFAQNPGIQDIFDERIVSSEVGLVKPEPEIYKLALEKLGVQPEEALFIDDGQANVDGAIAVGMQALLFTGADQLRTDLQELGLLA